MQIIHGFGRLVEDVLLVFVSKDFLPDQGVQVNIHMLEDQVDVLTIFCFDHLFQHDDVGVLQLHQKHYFSVGPLRVSRVIKRIEIFLQSLCLIGPAVDHFKHMPVCSTADLLDNFEPSQHVGLDFL